MLILYHTFEVAVKSVRLIPFSRAVQRLDPFRTNDLYFSGVFTGYKVGTLVRMGSGIG